MMIRPWVIPANFADGSGLAVGRPFFSYWGAQREADKASWIAATEGMSHWVTYKVAKGWRPIQWTGARYPERPVFVRDDDFDA